ncbi:hypothetical protein [Mycoplasma bradburyae]|uniref:hypothetical protein n=1 Tax=Mycoplasma bradburyae TaxID=2963128 RepID=UPI0023425EF8|nr:hypothetical protein [Mycoplasma bradburyae]MDC4163597.1 hypothetical protein [Mycoplasma bradburyae]MDC4184381.1 hypothetical protein [Mycoplasma bradburyae]
MEIKLHPAQRQYDYWHLVKYKNLKINPFFMLCPFANVFVYKNITTAWSRTFYSDDIRKSFNSYVWCVLLLPILFHIILFISLLIPFSFNLKNLEKDTFLYLDIAFSFNYLLTHIFTVILTYTFKNIAYKKLIKYCLDKDDLPQAMLDVYAKTFLLNITYGVSYEFRYFFQAYDYTKGNLNDSVLSNKEYIERGETLEEFFDKGPLCLRKPHWLTRVHTNPYIRYLESTGFYNFGTSARRFAFPIFFTRIHKANFYNSTYAYLGFVKSAESLLGIKFLNKISLLYYLYWLLTALGILVSLVWLHFSILALTYGHVKADNGYTELFLEELLNLNYLNLLIFIPVFGAVAPILIRIINMVFSKFMIKKIKQKIIQEHNVEYQRILENI